MKILILVNFKNRDMKCLSDEILYEELYTFNPHAKVIEHGCLDEPWDYYCIIETDDDGFINNKMYFWNHGEVLVMIMNSCTHE